MASEDIQYQLAHPGDDKSSQIVVSNAVVLPLAAVAVILRFTARRLCRAGLRADDWVILLSLILAAGEVGGGLLCVANGGAKHAVFLPDPAKFAKVNSSLWRRRSSIARRLLHAKSPCFSSIAGFFQVANSTCSCGLSAV